MAISTAIANAVSLDVLTDHLFDDSAVRHVSYGNYIPLIGYVTYLSVSMTIFENSNDSHFENRTSVIRCDVVSVLAQKFRPHHFYGSLHEDILDSF